QALSIQLTVVVVELKQLYPENRLNGFEFAFLWLSNFEFRLFSGPGFAIVYKPARLFAAREKDPKNSTIPGHHRFLVREDKPPTAPAVARFARHTCLPRIAFFLRRTSRSPSRCHAPESGVANESPFQP